MDLSKFTFSMNRSERATQAKILVPTLEDKDNRFEFFSRLNLGITKEESDKAIIMHFAWVLRDYFTFERNKANKNKEWQNLCKRWRKILGLPKWANQLGWWSHPNGVYNGEKNYVVHPCSTKVGWTKKPLNKRISQYNLKIDNKDNLNKLIHARRIMNTESDCFIQTPKRLIVIECKDKTNFKTEQEKRQQDLFECLKRLLVKPEQLEYIEISSETNRTRPAKWISWNEIKKINNCN